MLYCDLKIDGNYVWAGIPCKTDTFLKESNYIPFSGDLIFVNWVDSSDPDYTGLESKYSLMYHLDGVDMGIPLQAIPSQELNIILDSQNCTLKIYEKARTGTTPDEPEPLP